MGVRSDLNMKYKNEIVIISIITILILFLKLVNVFQIENGLGYPFTIVLMIICFSLATIFIQKNIDRNYRINKLNYQNLNILKYISSILIIILHLRPFLNFSNELDLAFNNIITRICVPIFFIITGYFVAKKEKVNENYIKEYIRKTIPLYFVWSLLYIPVIIGTIIKYLPIINEYISKINITLPFIIILSIILLPIIVLVALCYTGVYYHLWYFPAIIFSLIVIASIDKLSVNIFFDCFKKMETKIQYKIFINNFLYIVIVWGNRNLLWSFTIINKKNIILLL